MFGKKKTQEVSGAGNVSSMRDTIFNNYGESAIKEENAPTVIDEILNYVISNASKKENISKGLPEKLVKTNAKIGKNFIKAKEKEEVRRHFTYSYMNIAAIEEKYRQLDNTIQLDIHSHIFSVYQELKNTKPNIEILRDLFKFFLPPGKERDSQYINISKAFVLFFFDDCTIFEKTKYEKNNQTTLFSGL